VRELEDRGVDVVIADVSEHAADHHHVGRNGALVGGRGRSITPYDLHIDKPGALRCRSGLGRKIGIQLDQPSDHIIAAAVFLEHTDDVAALASTHADEFDRPFLRVVDGVADTALHDRQTPIQRRPWVLVAGVPLDPMPVGNHDG
jgi:hypothetical protein